jgi:hypothetical protein
VAIGDTVSLDWNTRSSYDFYLRPQNARTFAVIGDAVYDDFVITITDSATGAVLNGASVNGHPPHPSYQLDTDHTGPVELAPQQTARVHVSRIPPRKTGARFRIFLAPVNLAPESRSAVLQPGDTVNGETMADAVDVDRFYLRNTTGSVLELAVFAQSRAGFLFLSVLDSTLGTLLGSGSFTPDLTVRTVPFTRINVIPLQVGQTVQIQALQFGPGSGDYQLRMYPVNRAPEIIPAVFAINDTVQGETLENNADIDEFTVTIPPGLTLIGYYQGGTSLTSVGMSITGPVNGPVQAVTNRSSVELEDIHTFGFSPAAGALTVTHGANNGGQAVLHPYSFMVREINRQPEHRPVTITVGDSIGDEPIDYWGDIDEFEFAGTAGQTVTASILGLSGQPQVTLELFEGIGIYDWAYSRSGFLGSYTLQIPHNGTFGIRIYGGKGGYDLKLQ